MGSAEVIVDASAILAILLREPEEQLFVDVLTESSGEAVISPVNYPLIALRVDRGDMPEVSGKVDPLLLELDVSIAGLTSQQRRLAREAYREFGKGNHPAKLNLGDCFAYALAEARGEPLLFKGEDVRRTDVEAAF